MPNQKLMPTLLWSIRLLAGVTCCLCLYLTYVSLQTSDAVGCGFAGFDCDAVLASPWAKWFGLPVAALGLVVYLAALVGSWLVGSQSETTSNLGWRLLEFAIPVTLGAGIWFLTLQIFAVGAFCLYCLMTHAIGLVISILAITARRIANQSEVKASAATLLSGAMQASELQKPQPEAAVVAPPSVGLPIAISMVSLVLLTVGQFLSSSQTQIVVSAEELPTDFQFDDLGGSEVSEPVEIDSNESDTKQSEADQEEPDQNEPKLKKVKRRAGSSRVVKLLNGRLSIDTYKHPILGSPEAPHIVVEMMDYTCPHCRELHDKIKESIKLFDDQVAVVVLPVPMELLCNPYVKKPKPVNRGACKAAKLTVALSLTDPEEFASFHHWMLQGEKVPPYTSALVEAYEHVEPKRLSEKLKSEEVEQRISSNVALMGALYQINAKFALPTQIMGDKLAIGPPRTLEQLVNQWAEAFDLDQPTAEIPF